MTAPLLPNDRAGSGGLPVLLLPGITGHRRWMSPLAAALSPRHPTCAVTLPGETEAPGLGPDPRDAPFAEIGDRLAATLESCRLPRAVVLGTSFGGVAALEFARRHPDRVAALVLHATTGRPAALLAPWSRLLPYGGLAVCILNVRLLAGLALEAVAAARAGPQARSQLFQAGRLRLTTPMSVRAVAARLRRLASATDLEAALPGLRVPTLVLTPEPYLDLLIPAAEGVWLASRLPDAEHVRLPATGHLGALIRPDLVAGALAAFLARRGLA